MLHDLMLQTRIFERSLKFDNYLVLYCMSVAFYFL